MLERVGEITEFAAGGAHEVRDVRPARHGRLVARARGSQADVRQEAAARARHDAPGDDPACGAVPRSGEDDVHRLLEVGDDARDAVALRLLLGADRRSGAVHRGHRSRLEARAARGGAGDARVPRRADDRRPVLGAVALRDRSRCPDGHRRRASAHERRADGRGVPERREPRAATGPRARRRLAAGPRQGVHRGDRRATSGSGPSS